MSIIEKDIEEILKDKNIPWDMLDNKHIFITGATGIIGSLLTKALIKYNHNLKISVLVRSEKKANDIFGDSVEYIVGDVTDIIDYEEDVDYIIHCASSTSSKMFVNNPVDTIQIAVLGTYNVLEFARKKSLKGFVYTSTMEVYGYPETEDKINEDYGCNLDTMNIRSSYPESKRLCECLCSAYASQYDVPTKVIRLTQTFGSGVKYDDGRVFAEFARCFLEKRNIVLNTDGSTKRNYLYVSDAIRAILTVLLKGSTGNSYNAANEETFCSIKDMAELVSNLPNAKNIEVMINKSNVEVNGYAPKLFMNLDVTKLKKLGWSANIELEEAYVRLIQYLNEIKREM